MKNFYSEYAVLESQIKELENKKDALRTQILQDMIDNGEEKKETAFGKFTVSKLKKWTYSQKTLDVIEKVKTLKAKEESCGIATFTEQESLRYTALKI